LLEEYRRIPSEARYLSYLTFFPSLAQGLIYTDLAYFLTKIRGLSDVFMGTIITVMGITMVISSTPLGILADRYGKKRFLIIGNMLASLTLVLFALTANPAILVAAALVEGVTEGAFAASSTALLAEKAGNEARTSAFSLVAFLSNMAWGIAGFAIPAVSVLQALGIGGVEAHVVLYLIFAALSLASTLIILKVRDSGSTRRITRLRDFIPRKSGGVLIRYGLTSAIVAFGAGMFVPLMTRWFNLRYGVPDTVSGPILGISGFLIAAATLAAPLLARRMGMVRSIVLTEGFSAIFMVATPISPDYITAGAVYSIRSFMMNLANPLSQSMVMDLVAEEERGAAAGISAAIWRLPNSISTGIGAGIMGAGLLGLPFYIATVLYLLAISLFWSFFRNSRLSQDAGTNAHSPQSRA
jgi:MFS family permease